MASDTPLPSMAPPQWPRPSGRTVSTSEHSHCMFFQSRSARADCKSRAASLVRMETGPWSSGNIPRMSLTVFQTAPVIYPHRTTFQVCLPTARCQPVHPQYISPRRIHAPHAYLFQRRPHTSRHFATFIVTYQYRHILKLLYLLNIISTSASIVP